MIIKSMSRKEPTFGQLLDYMNREASDDRYSLRHNSFARKERELEKEFKHNASRLRARKNGVFLYHEILSITKTKQLSDHELKDALRRIAAEYIQARAPNNLVYGVVHDDHAHHLHYHLMISANEAGESTRTRLSKADFQNIKIELERRVLSEFPQLEQKVAIEKETGERLSARGAELKRRTGETPERDSVKETIRDIFADSLDKAELFARLRDANLNLYVRGKNIGIIHEGSKRKYRLNRLGLQERFETLSNRIETMERIERETQSERQAGAGSQETKKMKPLIETIDQVASKVMETGKKAVDTVRQTIAPASEHHATHHAPPGGEKAGQDEIDKIAQERAELLRSRHGAGSEQESQRKLDK